MKDHYRTEAEWLADFEAMTARARVSGPLDKPRAPVRRPVTTIHRKWITDSMKDHYRTEAEWLADFEAMMSRARVGLTP